MKRNIKTNRKQLNSGQFYFERICKRVGDSKEGLPSEAFCCTCLSFSECPLWNKEFVDFYERNQVCENPNCNNSLSRAYVNTMWNLHRYNLLVEGTPLLCCYCLASYRNNE